MEKYTDSFWRLAPVPLLVAGALVVVALRPSPLGLFAAALLVLVGALAQVVIWRGLRFRWERGVPPESVGQLVEPGSRIALLPALVVLFAAFTWRAFTLSDTAAQALGTAAIATAIYGVVIVVGVLKDRS